MRVLAGLAIAATAAHAAPPPQAAAWRPIDMALTAPLDQVRMRADLGDPSAQYAVSILDRYGLRGAPRDPRAADAWRDRALAARSLVVETTLGGGVNFAQPIQARPEVGMKFDVSPAQDALTRRCLGLLASTNAPPARRSSSGSCGDEATYERLKAAWSAAK